MQYSKRRTSPDQWLFIPFERKRDKIFFFAIKHFHSALMTLNPTQIIQLCYIEQTRWNPLTILINVATHLIHLFLMHGLLLSTKTYSLRETKPINYASVTTALIPVSYFMSLPFKDSRMTLTLTRTFHYTLNTLLGFYYPSSSILAT